MENQHKQTLMQEQWTKLQQLVQAYPKALQILPKAYLAQYQRLDQQLSSQEASPLQTEAEDKIRKKPFVEVLLTILLDIINDLDSKKYLHDVLDEKQIIELKTIVKQTYSDHVFPIAKEIGAALLAGIDDASSKTIGELAQKMALRIKLVRTKSYLQEHYKKHKDFYKKHKVVMTTVDGAEFFVVLDDIAFSSYIPTRVFSAFVGEILLDKSKQEYQEFRQEQQNTRQNSKQKN